MSEVGRHLSFQNPRTKCLAGIKSHCRDLYLHFPRGHYAALCFACSQNCRTVCSDQQCVLQLREMVNVFNDTVAEEGKTEVVEAGDPDGTLFLINPDVSPLLFPARSLDQHCGHLY